MDDSTHSVYLAQASGASWYAYAGKDQRAATCEGQFLGKFYEGGGCKNLDTAFAQRIRCLSTKGPPAI